MPGSLRSRRTRSGRGARSRCSAASADETSSVSWPRPRTKIWRSSPTAPSSSTISTRMPSCLRSSREAQSCCGARQRATGRMVSPERELPIYPRLRAAGPARARALSCTTLVQVHQPGALDEDSALHDREGPLRAAPDGLFDPSSQRLGWPLLLEAKSVVVPHLEDLRHEPHAHRV